MQPNPAFASAVPTALAIAADGRLQIDWSDGSVRLYRVRELREGCPCAGCREKRNAPPPPPPTPGGLMSLPILTPAEARPLELLGMAPVGNYAYSIQFSDGHDTGIYSFDVLRELGEDATK
jgi:DUF971 family protein